MSGGRLWPGFVWRVEPVASGSGTLPPYSRKSSGVRGVWFELEFFTSYLSGLGHVVSLVSSFSGKTGEVSASKGGCENYM